MAVIGYARISTHEQTLDLQRDAMHSVGVDCIYEDQLIGKSIERPELQQCLKALREGDTLVVWRLDRLGRTLRDLIRIVNELDSRGIKFRSLTESIDTSGPAGKLCFHLFAALAEFERELIKERTLAGLAAARKRGHVGGRPRIFDEKMQRAALAMLSDKPMTVTEVAKHFDVSRSTIYSLYALTQK